MHHGRVAAALALIERLELEAALIFSPEAQFYLLGHDSFAGVNTPQALILSPALSRPAMVMWSADVPMLMESTSSLDLYTYGFGIDTPAAVIAAALHKLVPGARRLGWEAATPALTHVLACDILRETGLTSIADITVEIARLRLIKTAEEISLIRKAAGYVEHGLAAVRAAARPGVSERFLCTTLENGLRTAGSEYWAVPVELASGMRAHHVHGTATDRVLETGDLLHVEFAGVHRRYHAVGIQTLAVGRAPSPDAAHLYETARRCLSAGLAAAWPGIPAAEIEVPALEILRSEGLGDAFSMRFGYSVGIGYPPSWLEPFGISRTNPNPVVPGMVFVMHACLLEAEAKLGVLVGGTYAMTEEGLVSVAGAGAVELATG